MRISREQMFLGLFFALVLALGPGTILAHQLNHPFPFGYGASDAFQHQVRAEAIKEQGNFRYEAPYIAKGFGDAVGRYPPVLYHLAILLASASGMEVYDSILFLVLFMPLLGALAMFFIVSSFDKRIAYLALPVSIMVYSHPLSIAFYWGHWPAALAQVFLILFAWTVLRMDEERSWLLMGISLSTVVLTHTSEAIFAGIFLSLVIGVRLLTKKLGRREITAVSLMAGTALMICGYFLIIFLNTWAVAQPYEFRIDAVWEGNPGFYIAGFGLLLLPLTAGTLLGLWRVKRSPVPLLFGYAMLIGGFMNYAGFEVRSFQLRFFWPIFLGIFIGYGLFLVMRLAKKRMTTSFSMGASAGLLFLMMGILPIVVISQTETQSIPLLPQLTADSNQGIMLPELWDTLTWLSANTPEDAEIYFFYGDRYSQDALLRNSERVHYQVDPEDFVQSIQDRKIRRHYLSEQPGDSGGTISYRTSLFSFADHLKEKPKGFDHKEMDICQFDYFVLDKVSGNQVLAQYNMLLAQALLNSSLVEVAYENPLSVILKNNDQGGECIEPRDF